MPPPTTTGNYKVKVIVATTPEKIQERLEEFLNTLPAGSRLTNTLSVGPWWASWTAVVYESA